MLQAQLIMPPIKGLIHPACQQGHGDQEELAAVLKGVNGRAETQTKAATATATLHTASFLLLPPRIP